MDELRNEYDVVVVGGGAAGLNGALMLARSRRSVVVIDAGEPRNAPAEAVHGLFARDGVPPAVLLERGRAEVRSYGGQVIPGRVEAITHPGHDSAGHTHPGHAGFSVTLADGRSTHARRILVATGLVDELADIPGLRDRWGRDVVHCPYCHGWEVRDRAIGVLATGPLSVHQALLFRQLSDDVMFFTAEPLPDEQAAQFAARDIAVVHGRVASVAVTGDQIEGVRLEDGTLIAREVLAVAPRMVARVGFLAPLGLLPAAHQSGGEHIPAGPTGRTAVEGVWIAGNATDPSAQVGGAAAAGATAGAQINADLVTEETRLAVETQLTSATAS